MKNTMEYKGYTGSVEFSEPDSCFCGQVLFIRDLVSYEGQNATELLNDFHEAVDDYLLFCKEEGIEPDKPYKGSFNVRISPELHGKAAVYAINNNISLNSFVEQAIREKLQRCEKSKRSKAKA